MCVNFKVTIIYIYIYILIYICYISDEFQVLLMCFWVWLLCKRGKWLNKEIHNIKSLNLRHIHQKIYLSDDPTTYEIYTLNHIH